jgi:hypothetical protein
MYLSLRAKNLSNFEDKGTEFRYFLFRMYRKRKTKENGRKTTVIAQNPANPRSLLEDVLILRSSSIGTDD